MEQYFGTERQIRLQRKTDGLSKWLLDTPGAALVGRAVGTDDPDRLGWATILEHLKQDGSFGFRLVPTVQVDKHLEILRKENYGFHSWNTFCGDAGDVLAATDKLNTGQVPDGLTLLSRTGLQDQNTIRDIQDFHARNDIPPVSGLLLTGGVVPSTLVVLRDGSGVIVATAFGHVAHNQHSPHHKNIWGGLVAVDQSQRGNRLGIWVNARMLRNCIRDLGAERVYEMASEENTLSRKMLERCGLKLNPSVTCGVALAASVEFKRS